MSGVGSQIYSPIEKFREIDGPIIDVRSPKEFNQGHWPGSINLPLFSDKERETIGKAYKLEGSESAVILGVKIAGPKINAIKNELEEIMKGTFKRSLNKTYSIVKIYCWRGGMRSASFCWLSNLLGFNSIILQGGYKSYRRWVLKSFSENWPIKLMGGRTGTGKTNLLLELKEKGIAIIDLEGIANHRGSSFGSLGQPPQPSTEHFENMLLEELVKYKRAKAIWLEAESANLGKCRIPKELFNQMKNSFVLEIERSKEERVKELINVYSNFEKSSLEEATNRISRRLGPQRTRKAIESITEGNWDEACLAMLDYYDKCYDYELKKAPQRKTISISGLNTKDAAIRLVNEGLVY